MGSSEAARAGPWRSLAARLAAQPSARFALLGLGVLLVLALAGPLLSPWRFDALDWRHLAAPPGPAAAHWLGTDRLGRDLYVRVLGALRLSLLVSLCASAVSVVFGIGYGALAGYAGGRTDQLMMRAVDVLYSLPYLLIVIIFTSLLPRGSLAVLFVALGAVGWLTSARIVRAQTLALKRRPFIEAARALGVPPARIVTRHVLPNLIGPVIVYATLTVPQMILYEGFLSFLGLGVQEPRASLGNLIANGAQEMSAAPWLIVVPSVLLVTLLLCLNRLGDALRDALDPHQE